MHHLSNWIEIPVHDIARATAFYERVLGTALLRAELAGNQYAMFPASNRYNTGALVEGPGYVPSSQGTLIYLDARGEIDAMLQRVSEAGGSVLLPRTPLSEEAGEVALFLDSEGNRVGLQNALVASAEVADETMQALLA
ncbi:MAG TPA: VOC family protein, partial [Polyangiales bacterium]